MSTAQILVGVRNMLRDFPVYFEVEQGPLNTLTVRLEHPYVSAQTLQVFSTDFTDPENPVVTQVGDSEWMLDERNGLVKLENQAYLGNRILIAGHHYSWFTDGDLLMHTADVLQEFVYESNKEDPDDLDGIEIEVAKIGVVVRALWSLMCELALDVDVSTPEGMFIPAHQRFQQVENLMATWEKKYEEMKASLGMGLGKLEIFHLRRTARLTNRYVPMYKERELEDPFWPERVFPSIPDLVTEGDESNTLDVIEVTEAYKPGGRFRSGIYPSATYPEMLGRGSWNV
jgi:hypothetical protein